MSTLAIARQWALTWARERAGRDGMSSREAARWAACQDMDDLRQLVTVWLAGGITRNPDHMGPPCAETIPLIPVLSAVNQAGFLTDNSQRAGSRHDHAWNAWVAGFISPGPALALLDRALRAYGLEAETCHRASCRDPDCPRQEVLWFWVQACPLAADQLSGAWWVYAEDPEPGRNDRLWPALSAFSQLTRYGRALQDTPESG